ncbi:MAG: NAD(P)-dependent oxidoreductase [Chloroflexi bacterium]|nr:NAD(P)-dependent oxidoreductase [Chloroflexota bacterium]
MRVLITGGAGLIGKAITSYLQERGWDIHIIDVAVDPELPGATYSVCDILDFDGVRAQMHGCDAVVHMAALRNPYYAPGQDVYRVNTAGTFNVFEAAAREGIRRVVQASSINAIGCMWNTTDFSPRYLPIDEDHPGVTTDPYSFSKQQIEEIGAYYWRRDGISSTALRFPGITEAKAYRSPQYWERRSRTRSYLDEFAALPDAERDALLAEVRRQSLAWRAGRPMEYPAKSAGIPPADNLETFVWRAYTFDRANLWASMDERDAAQAVEKSLTADFSGAHTMFVNDSHNWLDYETNALARLFFADVREWKRPLTGSESLVSIERARNIIGFEPRYSAHGGEHD